jgi:hypothetical protein
MIRFMPVALRDPRHSTRGRDWFVRARAAWFTELGASAADVAAAPVLSIALITNREVVLFERDEQFVGFAVLHRTTTLIRLDEFFIMKESRALGIGAAAARLLFDRFAGQWEIASLANDQRALAFWRHVLIRYAPGTAQECRERGEVIQRFLSKGAR